MIGQATRWLEVAVQPNKESITTAESFDREWLCRYPRPRQVVHDQGLEFTGEEFQELLRSYGLKSKPITKPSASHGCVNAGRRRNGESDPCLSRIYQLPIHCYHLRIRGITSTGVLVKAHISNIEASSIRESSARESAS